MKYYRFVNLKDGYVYGSGYNSLSLFDILNEYSMIVSEPFADSLDINGAVEKLTVENNEEQLIEILRTHNIEVQTSETEFDWNEECTTLDGYDKSIGGFHYEVYKTHEDGSTESVEEFDNLFDAVKFQGESNEPLQIDLWINGSVYSSIDAGDTSFEEDLEDLLFVDDSISEEFRVVIMKSVSLKEV